MKTFTKHEMIHNENALKSVIYFKNRPKDIQNLLLEYITYMHSDSLLFLSKISTFIKDKNISSWIRGDVGESLLKLNLDMDNEISAILKEILLDKSINSSTRFYIARYIFTFQKDENFIQEIGEIINDKEIGFWLKGGLLYALSKIGNKDYSEIMLAFMFDESVNNLVKFNIMGEVIPFLLKSKKYESDTFNSIISIIKNNDMNFGLRSNVTLVLSRNIELNTTKLKILFDLMKDPMLDILIRVNLAEVLLKLNYQNNNFFLALRLLIKNKNLKLFDMHSLYKILELKRNLNKEYIRTSDVMRSKFPKYINVNGSLMKYSKYRKALSKGIRF